MKFASIGDLCVDTYPDKKILGGTSYNSAIVAKDYGAEVSIISAIGKDANGDLYKNSFAKNNIDSSHVQVLNSSTSAVHITLDENNSPVFGEWELGALNEWVLSRKDLDFIATHDIVKITCLKPLEKKVKILFDAKMPNTIKAADFDGDSQYSFTPKELIKFIDGLDVVIKSLNKNNTEEIDLLKKIAKEKKKIILITLGEGGSICFDKDKMYQQEAARINPTNTTGFGDAFLAVFLIVYFESKDIKKALEEATTAIIKIAKN